MLMVVLANVRSNMSVNALIYYSLAYSLGSIAAFGIVYNVTKNGNENIDSFNGLSKRNPVLALCMTVSMLSLAGIPITSGFFAKYFVFTTLIGTQYKWLIIIAVLTSLVGVYYYLRVIIAMYFKKEEIQESINVEKSNMLVISLTALATIVIGVAPSIISEMFSF
jgi:NADH-quinone oxidoreductase subunit N